MTSSAKKKRAKAATFAKAKLRVGKAAQKPANHTDTSFRSRAIVLASQSLALRAPETPAQFSHHLSLLSHHAAATRKDSLAFLTSHLRRVAVPPATILPKLAPLILDPSLGVRSQLLGLLKEFRPDEARLQMHMLLLHVWSAMSHIDPDVRRDSTGFLGWALDVAPEETMANGGWEKGLRALAGCLEGGGVGRQLRVVEEFLGVGGGREEGEVKGEVGVRGGLHWSARVNIERAGVGGYRYLGLFGGGGDLVEDAEGRRRWCCESVSGKEVVRKLREVLVGLTKEGGEVGRTAGRVLAVLERVVEAREEGV